MGLLKKLKNIFYDEEVIEVPVQNKEESKPKIEEVVLPKRDMNIETKREEPKKETSFSERELFKSETTFNFPIFDDEEEIKPKSRSSILDIEDKGYKGTSAYKETSKNEPKVFRPSPVISPIYGVLDKNYRKEEIIEKKDYHSPSPKEINYDYVRHKAYGTLEDELENTLTRMQKNNEDIEEEIVEKVEQMQNSADDIENLLTKIEKNANVSIGELEEAQKLKEDLEEEKEEPKSREVKRKIDYDTTLEHDLFNLIDSMYEDKED